MWRLPDSIPIFLYSHPADLRRGFDGLCALAEGAMGKNPMQGGLYLFCNRRRDQVKILFWERDGLCIYHKRLERGRFQLPQAPSHPQRGPVCLSASQLFYILDGIALKSVKPLRRFRLPPSTLAA